MFDYNSEIFKRFSCNNWILIPTGVTGFLSDLKKIGSCKWGEAPIKGNKKIALANGNKLTLLVSHGINGYCLLEILGPNYHRLLQQIARGASFTEMVYSFGIDLWVPEMRYQVFEKGELNRGYEIGLSELNNNELDCIDVEQGKLNNDELRILNSVKKDSPEYEFFWFPLKIMKYLGISPNDLIQEFEKSCSIFELTKTDKNFF